MMLIGAHRKLNNGLNHYNGHKGTSMRDVYQVQKLLCAGLFPLASHSHIPKPSRMHPSGETEKAGVAVIERFNLE